MRFALNGWPPLASHTAALLVGGAIAGFNRPPAESSPRLSPRTLMVALPAEFVQASLKEAGVTPESPLDRGSQWNFIRPAKTDRPPCRLGEGSWRIADVKRATLLGGHEQAGAFANIVPLLRKRDVVLMRSEQSASLPLCTTVPKVIYGSP